MTPRIISNRTVFNTEIVGIVTTARRYGIGVVQAAGRNGLGHIYFTESVIGVAVALAGCKGTCAKKCDEQDQLVFHNSLFFCIPELITGVLFERMIRIFNLGTGERHIIVAFEESARSHFGLRIRPLAFSLFSLPSHRGRVC